VRSALFVFGWSPPRVVGGGYRCADAGAPQVTRGPPHPAVAGSVYTPVGSHRLLDTRTSSKIQANTGSASSSKKDLHTCYFWVRRTPRPSAERDRHRLEGRRSGPSRRWAQTVSGRCHSMNLAAGEKRAKTLVNCGVGLRTAFTPLVDRSTSDRRTE